MSRGGGSPTTFGTVASRDGSLLLGNPGDTRLRRTAAGVVQLDAAAVSGLRFAVGTYAGGTAVGGVLSYGTGAPNNANGADGDVYLRVDGGAATTIYQRRAGAWVGVV